MLHSYNIPPPTPCTSKRWKIRLSKLELKSYAKRLGISQQYPGAASEHKTTFPIKFRRLLIILIILLIVCQVINTVLLLADRTAPNQPPDDEQSTSISSAKLSYLELRSQSKRNTKPITVDETNDRGHADIVNAGNHIRDGIYDKGAINVKSNARYQLKGRTKDPGPKLSLVDLKIGGDVKKVELQNRILSLKGTQPKVAGQVVKPQTSIPLKEYYKLKKTTVSGMKNIKSKTAHGKEVVEKTGEHKTGNGAFGTMAKMYMQDAMVINCNKPTELNDNPTKTAKNVKIKPLRIQNSRRNYWTTDDNEKSCFKPGTTTQESDGTCVCDDGWWGDLCDIPDSIQYDTLPFSSDIKPIMESKRLIVGFSFDNEFELLEARFSEYHDVVDMFVILESNYTVFSETKLLPLKRKLLAREYADVADKIVYVFMDHIPLEAKANHDRFTNSKWDYIEKQGLRQQMTDLRDDDIFILTDANEIISRDVLLYLKTHTGYPEPFGFSLQWSVYGFFWNMDIQAQIFGGASMKFINVYTEEGTGLSELRHANLNVYRKFNKLFNKRGDDRLNVSPWIIGSDISPAGYLCQFCVAPSYMKQTLTEHFPYKRSEVIKERQIEHNIRMGKLTQGNRLLIANDCDITTCAPRYFHENKEKFPYLLRNPYLNP